MLDAHFLIWHDHINERENKPSRKKWYKAVEYGEIKGDKFIETVKPFLFFYKHLNEYAKHTKKFDHVSTLRFRDVLAAAKDPEKAFFEDLPEALGYDRNSLNGNEFIESYCVAIQRAVRELRYCYRSLIDRIESYNGNTVKTFSPQEYKTIMTKDEAEFLKEMMTGVVERGTASKLKGLSYTAAGKTGSAEYSAVKTDSHAWFTGFAPVDDPQVCVTIIVEGAGSGGEYAVPMAKRIFDTYFQSKGLN